MMRCALVLLSLLGLAACRKEAPAPAPTPAATATTTAPVDLGGKSLNLPVSLAKGAIKRCQTGTSLGKDGTVSIPTAIVTRRDPVYVTLWLDKAPVGLQVAARFVDEQGEEVAMVRKDVEAQQTVSLLLDKRLEPGKYRVEGYWGGNVGCEVPLEIVSGPKPKP